jgi:hypothetical protein
VRLPSACLVVLVGPSGCGKSSWAGESFRGGQVVSSDALRALVGEGPDDQRAGKDAFVATLDVLSGGRAICGIGAAWFEREHAAYGYRFPPLAERYRMLADALELLRLMWAPGSPSYEGRTTSLKEAICYPRPLQQRLPILVGGSGERSTLRLAARHADACNLFGGPEVVRHKVEGTWLAGRDLPTFGQ